jgi:tRNA-2-methylthio-N6-dimethylallyladenosine synthase
LVERAKAGAHSQVAVNYREEWEEIPDEFDAVARTDGRPEVRALVAIQRGCNKNCTYCVVPTTRGAEVSRDPKEIEREVRLKVRGGAREVLLLGQTVNSYGKDLSPRFSFEQLVERLSEIPDLKRIRFTSPHPQDVRQEFIELYGRIPQLVPHIHLPLQSGSDRILKLMNRNYRVRRYREIVGALRERVPQIALTTDIIVGFPTETEEDFLHTLELVHEMRYHSIFSFCYSIRPNTPAQQTYAPEGEPTLQESQSRLQRLQKAQEVISNELNTATVGTTVEVLVEGPTKHISSAWRGRTPQNTLVEVAGEMPALGELVQVKIEYAGPHFLRGRAV